MNKEEILLKSRKENKDGDEREMGLAKGSGMIVIIAFGVSLLVLSLIEAIFLETEILTDGLGLQLFFAWAVQQLYLLITLKKKHYILTSICSVGVFVLALLRFIDTVASMM